MSEPIVCNVGPDVIRGIPRVVNGADVIDWQFPARIHPADLGADKFRPSPVRLTLTRGQKLITSEWDVPVGMRSVHPEPTHCEIQGLPLAPRKARVSIRIETLRKLCELSGAEMEMSGPLVRYTDWDLYKAKEDARYRKVLARLDDEFEEWVREHYPERIDEMLQHKLLKPRPHTAARFAEGQP